MAQDDWYRSTTWEKEDQELFEEKLSRVRSNFHKAQNVRIKATSLADSENPKVFRAAEILFLRVINDYPEEIDEVKSSYWQLGELYEDLGEPEKAETSYRKCIEYDKIHSDVWTSEVPAEFSLAKLLVNSNSINKLTEAEKIFDKLSKKDNYLIFNSEIFEYYVSRARLSNKLNNTQEASKYALKALETAENGSVPQLSRHPKIGLVKTTKEIINEMKSLTTD